MTKLQTPWILMLALVAAPASASAQEESEGPISRLVARFRQPAHQHQHQHTHAQPAAPAYEYTYAQAEPAAVQEVQYATQEAAPVAAPVAEQETLAYNYAGGCDPYGFMHVLNRIRASAGLHPLAYDADLSSWAQQNNAEQCRRGLGHHVNPAGIQNCAYNYSDADSTAAGWMNSPGHRDNMLSPAATRFGIAFGPGPYWTLNAR